MKNRSLYLAALLGTLACYGCSDDSNEVTPQYESECSAGADCKSGACVDGTCAVKVGKGENCDKHHICDDNLLCQSGKCAEKDGDTPQKCKDNSECAANQKCEKGDCVDLHDQEPECQSTSECGEGKICDGGTCKNDPNNHGDGTCQENADCADQGANTTCMKDNHCGHYVNLGDACGDNGAYCQDGYECDDICYQKLNAGDACDPDSSTQLCDAAQDLECIDGICHAYENNIQLGNACSSYQICSEGLECKDSQCVSIRKESESCDESNYLICDKGLVCSRSVCTHQGDSCTKTADCTEKDSFCCLSDDCGAKGYCIPYDDEITHDTMCRFKTKPGIFEAQIQCRWQPNDGVANDSKSVEMPPLVGPFGNKKGLKNVIAVYSYGGPTVIRFIDPENCDTLESIQESIATRWYNYPASADLDGDGLFEFITVTNGNNSHLYVYKWDQAEGKHKKWIDVAADFRSTPMVFDIDNDGLPEIVSPVGQVLRVHPDGKTDLLFNQDLFDDTNIGLEDWSFEAGNDAAIGYLLKDDYPDVAQLVTGEGLYTWNKTDSKWDRLCTFPNQHQNIGTWVRQFPAYADFGTPGASADSFDFTKLDGKPEIVISGKNRTMVFSIVKKEDGSYDPQEIMHVDGFQYGGPVTIGDFNNDGLPEIGIASSGLFGVYDPKCKQYEEGKCADKNVLWERWSQDWSSGTTGSSLFDFDGDGQAEAVYADECFTRVYDGKTGAVLFSTKRSSTTSIEGPIIADIDGDGSAEILMGSDANHACYNDTSTNEVDPQSSSMKPIDCVDPIHEGIRCEVDEDCPKGVNCRQDIHLCTCTSDDDCNTQYVPGSDTILQQYVCAPPIDPQVGMMVNKDGGTKRTILKNRGTRPAGWTESDYRVCRATRKTNDIGRADLMILKDRLDRWVSSRTIWNQHAYNIINIEDNGKVPSLTQWFNNWLKKHSSLKIELTGDDRPLYNNYRLNSQGEYGAGMAPDITGRFLPGSICGTMKDENGKESYLISGKLCNRGTKPVGKLLPATFFYYDENAPDHRGQEICTSYTKTVVGVGECSLVGCEVDKEELEKLAHKKVLMISNLDTHGNASTVECNTDNNTDTIEIDDCKAEIVIY